MYTLLALLGATGAVASSSTAVTRSAMAPQPLETPAPKAWLFAPNWTHLKFNANDKGKPPKDGYGFGTEDDRPMASFGVPFEGDFHSQRFILETYKDDGEWIAINSSSTLAEKQTEAEPVLRQRLAVSSIRCASCSPRVLNLSRASAAN